MIPPKLVLINRRNLNKKSFLSLVFFSIPPFISIVLQIRFYGISLMLNSVVFSLLVVFLNVQNYSMYTDHLTNINNRKKLDIYKKKNKVQYYGKRILSYSAWYKWYLRSTNNHDVLNRFTDKGDISDYALDSMSNLITEELIIGTEGTLNPQANTTRAEAAVFLYRLYNKY